MPRPSAASSGRISAAIRSPERCWTQVGFVPDRRERRRLDAEAERRGEPDRAEHAQRVLAEPGRPDRRPRAASAAPGRRGRRAGRRAGGSPAGLGAPGDGVDGEVATGEVELDRVGELDPMRPSEVGVVVVGAERRDLDVTDRRVAGPDGDRPEGVLVDGARGTAPAVCSGQGRRSRGPSLGRRDRAARRAASRRRRRPRDRPTRASEQVVDGCAGQRRRGIDGGRPASGVSSAPGTGTSARRRCGRRRGTA